MATDTNETIEDIIAEMRALSNPISDGIIAIHGRSIADRLEAAYKREIDVLKQRCSELNAEVAAKDEVIKRLNDAISEEQKRKMATPENSSAVGDCAKLREALEFAEDELWAHGLFDASKRIASALAAPPRNCDVGTAEEQSERFDKFCHANINTQRCCGDCPAFRTTRDDCELVWAQMSYVEKEGGEK